MHFHLIWCALQKKKVAVFKKKKKQPLSDWDRSVIEDFWSWVASQISHLYPWNFYFILTPSFTVANLSCVVVSLCSKGWWECGSCSWLHGTPGADDFLLPADSAQVSHHAPGLSLVRPRHHHRQAQREGERVRASRWSHTPLCLSLLRGHLLSNIMLILCKFL